MDQRRIESADQRIVATFDDYLDAQAAVDYLADQDFPVERVAIVADGIRLVERATGQMTYGRAALSGAIPGALVGAFFGFLFGLFNWIDPLISGLMLALYGLIFGAIIGAVLGLIGHALSSGQRDFSSVRGIDAERFSVMVDPRVADEAAGLLGNFRGGRAVPPTGERGGTPAVG